MKKVFIIIISLLMLIPSLSSCKKGEEELPEVKRTVLPEEKLSSSLTVDGFAVNIYKSYAEIVGYSGKDTALTLPDSAAGVTVKSIAKGVFEGNKKILTVTLPKGLIRIGSSALRDCTSLVSVTFNEKLEEIGDFALSNTAITAISLPSSVNTIGKYAFSGTKITEFAFPDNILSVGKNVLENCTQLSSVTFCKRLTELPERAFYNCTQLKEVKIPDNIKELGEYAFASCTSLTRLNIGKGTEKIGEGLLADCVGAVISAPAGSAAEKYAKRNALPFERSGK